ncbi:MAG: ATP-dependent DNA helicase RecG [Saprospiraceae bacterium]|nr:ATP-dependent DNA helicase RecG [Saprospiraceae bacterium]MBK7795568.1 ATP-dependent DNA helicase RecG [Saprospiraceae bacterium]
MTSKLDTSIEFLKGVGPARAKLLNKHLNIFTFGDLLSHFPFRYVDKSVFHNIKSLVEDEYAQLLVSVSNLKIRTNGKTRWLTAKATDATGQMELIWFKFSDWQQELLQAHQYFVIYGKVNHQGNNPSIIHPEVEPYNPQQQSSKARWEGIYSSGEVLAGNYLHSKGLHKLISQCLSQVSERDIPETLPQYMISKIKVISKYQAILQIHQPRTELEINQARDRMKFEELFYVQLRLLKNKYLRQTQQNGILIPKPGLSYTEFISNFLPFKLTKAQERVLQEIKTDLKSGHQMNRLLQGDVGSGKTIVALLTMLMTIDHDLQACIMAPTEVLAMQHYKGISELLAPTKLNCELLTSQTKTRDRKLIYHDLESGMLKILVGTHALLEDKVRFKKLGIVVIDEQHRFGVGQRAKLWEKNESTAPHILVMTATPIPRTLAMSLYGDLDISIIDELPPGRKEIKTIHVRDFHRMQLYEFMRKEIALGRQIYIVYPLIEESEKLDIENLNLGYQKLLEYFPEPTFRISVVHGRMKAQDKADQMDYFVRGLSHIMVATTVIEVGVNVPNASVMVIENAERFGLSQLHQLRGRVGRGSDQSYCMLMTADRIGKVSAARIKIMCDTNDGFKIAQADLEIRGPGDIDGTRQSGLLELKVANIYEDNRILQAARSWAEQILKKDPSLENPHNRQLKGHLLLTGSAKFWGRIS